MSTETPSWLSSDGLALDTKELKKEVECCSKSLSSSEHQVSLEGGKRFYDLIMAVWALHTSLAMDAAELVCAAIRESGGLDSMLNLMSSEDAELRLQVSKGLEQAMTAANRSFIAGHQQFDALVKVACDQSSLEAMQCGTGILENLFKDSQETCLRLIASGAMEGILLGCRGADPTVLQHCAAALANSSMYGGPKCQIKMVAKHADHWLFPLAFSKDIVVKYYALLAICFLASNPELESVVARSGTLTLVLPFLQTQDPEEFPKTCHNHAHGRSAGWLTKLLPLLTCGNEEARSLSAFHFAMETAVKKKQGRLQVFDSINALHHLRQSAKMGSHLTASLCVQALETCSADLPHYYCWNAFNWSPHQVREWVEDIGLRDQAPAFEHHLVTGHLLLDLTMEDLEELGFQSRLQSRWFLKEIRHLRCLIDVSILDDENISVWLSGISKTLRSYAVDFIRHGVSRSLLPHLTDSTLQELGVHSCLDRLKLQLAVDVLSSGDSDQPDSVFSTPVKKRGGCDVFISYRRTTGSQLASLLKVHLQVRGLSVFLDVEELGSGKFDDAILSTISRCSNMLLVLSAGALERCKGDSIMQDWVHRELACALEHKVHIIPVLMDNFQWPKQTELPEDIQQICSLNGVPWSHEYQDACVEKIVNFLDLPTPRTLRMRSRRSEAILLN